MRCSRVIASWAGERLMLAVPVRPVCNYTLLRRTVKVDVVAISVHLLWFIFPFSAPNFFFLNCNPEDTPLSTIHTTIC